MTRSAGIRFVPVLAALAFLAIGACSSERREPSAARALDAITALASRDPRLATMIPPRADAPARAPDTSALDADTRGQIVTRGWRSSEQQRFSDLGAKLPETAAEPLSVGVSRFTSRHLRVSIAGAAAVHAELTRGAVVYAEALPSTDRVVTATTDELEDFLVLHDARAPRSFTWNIQLPETVARVVTNEGMGGERVHGLSFEDARGRPVLVMAPPWARDATGSEVPLSMTWNEADHALVLALPERAVLSYPVVIDPRYETSVWSTTTSRTPATRYAHAMAFDSARNEIVLFGGAGSTGLLDDTWVWSSVNSSWAKRAPPVSPSPRQYPAMTFDAVRGEVVLFGGYRDINNPLGDTWVWSSAASTWTQRLPVSSPPARSSSALAFDSARSEVVLFGGAASANRFADTWVWNGTTWTQRTPAASPPKRYGHVLAFDSSRNETVLFAGQDILMLNDTWVWNGTAWSQRSPASAPSVRIYPTAAFDTRTNEVFLFGGVNATTTRFADTWVWTQRLPATYLARHANQPRARVRQRARRGRSLWWVRRDGQPRRHVGVGRRHVDAAQPGFSAVPAALARARIRQPPQSSRPLRRAGNGVRQ